MIWVGRWCETYQSLSGELAEVARDLGVEFAIGEAVRGRLFEPIGCFVDGVLRGDLDSAAVVFAVANAIAVRLLRVVTAGVAAAN